MARPTPTSQHILIWRGVLLSNHHSYQRRPQDTHQVPPAHVGVAHYGAERGASCPLVGAYRTQVTVVVPASCAARGFHSVQGDYSPTP